MSGNSSNGGGDEKKSGDVARKKVVNLCLTLVTRQHRSWPVGIVRTAGGGGGDEGPISIRQVSSTVAETMVAKPD